VCPGRDLPVGYQQRTMMEVVDPVGPTTWRGWVGTDCGKHTSASQTEEVLAREGAVALSLEK